MIDEKDSLSGYFLKFMFFIESINSMDDKLLAVQGGAKMAEPTIAEIIVNKIA
jgi:hypothetical protein